MRYLVDKKTFVYLLLFTAGGILVMFSCNSRKGKSNEEEVHAGDSGLYTPQLSRLTDSIKAYPDSAALYFERGKLFFETEDFEHARKDMKKAIVLNALLFA